MKIFTLLFLVQKRLLIGTQLLMTLLGRLRQVGKKGVYSKSAKPRSKQQRKYNSTPEQNKRRSSRNKARRAKPCPGKDVHHKDGNPKNNKKSNLTCQSASKNRSNNKRKSSAAKSKAKK